MKYIKEQAAVMIAMAAIVCSMTLGAVSAYAGEHPARAFDIHAQSLATALSEFARQSRQEILFAPKIVADKRTEGVRGTLEPLLALSTLLKNTGLGYSTTPSGAILIAAPNTATTTGAGVSASDSTLRMARMEEGRYMQKIGDSGQQTDSTRSADSSANAGKDEHELVVTGSRIVGATQASPVQSVGRDQFRAQGSISLQDVLRDIPANFSGDYTAEATGAGQGGGITNNAYNRGRATAPNIHGLGAAATLSLLNGRRLPTASNGYSVDLSMIPLIALNRVDVLADGASPIYGADAIAGVVNLITRRNEEIFETNLRLGAPTDSGYRQLQLAQAFGTRWEGGSAFLAYQFDDQDALRAYQRQRTSNLRFNTFVMPEQTQHAAYLQLEQHLTDRFRVGAEALYSKRDFEGTYDYFGGQLLNFTVKGDQFLAAATGDLDLSRNWNLSSFVQFSGAGSKPTLLYGNTNPAPIVAEDFTGDEVSAGVTVSGRLFDLRDSPVRAAFGAEYRDEGRKLAGFGDTIKPFDVSRQVTSAFTEVQVPLARNFDLSAALRYDDYSDFGDTTNPKLGMVWAAAEGLRLRGTYSTSFRALSLKDAYGQVSIAAYRYVIDSTAPGGQTLALFINGNPKPGVRPEESDNFTLGVDYAPPGLEGLSFAATFFNVSYNGRLASPNQAVIDILNLNLPDTAPFITRNPTLAQVQALMAAAAATGSFTGMNHTPDQVRVIVDNSFANLAKSKARGVDLDVLWETRVAGSVLNLSSRTTFGLDYLTAASSTLPEIELIGTVFYPAKFRTRTGANLQRGMFHGGVAVNYTSGFTDDRYTPHDPISSWTTIDINLGVDMKVERGVLAGLSLELVARNLFNEAPPYVLPHLIAPGDLPNYDSANASVIGRTISLQASKRW